MIEDEIIYNEINDWTFEPVLKPEEKCIFCNCFMFKTTGNDLDCINIDCDRDYNIHLNDYSFRISNIRIWGNISGGYLEIIYLKGNSLKISGDFPVTYWKGNQEQIKEKIKTLLVFQ